VIVQINTDNNIEGSERMEAYLKEMITGDLDRYIERITRIEVHLSDVNGAKKGLNDKKCLLEARLEGRKPIAVTNLANSSAEAVSGALDKLHASLETIIGKERNY
jgi:ribosome-associated translation inhibitor RaiA